MKDEIKYAPSFKENNTGRFKFIDQKWVECSEDEIASLWAKWVVHPESRRFIDEDGFLVFVYLI